MKATIETSKMWNGEELTSDMFIELQQAMVSSAGRIAAVAKALVPYGAEERTLFKGVATGHLRDTIRARGGRKGKLRAIVHTLATGAQYEKALPTAYVFAGDREHGIYWPHFVEYGTYFRDAHPFLRPAMDANFNATQAEAERAGRRALNKRRRERRQKKKLG